MRNLGSDSLGHTWGLESRLRSRWFSAKRSLPSEFTVVMGIVSTMGACWNTYDVSMMKLELRMIVEKFFHKWAP